MSIFSNRGMPDTPVIGYFTQAFGGAFGSATTEEEMKAAFDKIDEDKSGSLDKQEIYKAMIEMGKVTNVLYFRVGG